MDEDALYLEQFCAQCHDETDQRTDPSSSTATCLRCGTAHPVQGEEDRVGALLQRVREDDAASLERLRGAAVPLL